MNLSWDRYFERSYAGLDSGEIAASYRHWVEPFLAQAPKRILDVGVGPGQYLAAAAQLAPQAALCGVDVSKEFLRRACAELRARGVGAALLLGDGRRLPFADRSLDLVISQLTLTLAKDDRAFLCECVRVLQPGGVMWLSTHGVGFYLVRIRTASPYLRVRWLASLAAGCCSMALGWKPLKDTPVTPAWLRRQLERLGLEIKALEWSTVGSWPRIITVAAVKPLEGAEGGQRT